MWSSFYRGKSQPGGRVPHEAMRQNVLRSASDGTSQAK
ncbi:hypothetical protein LHGZ1_3138 [Laribacter hongkongensis]|uniref:Uncharacterized protein n=1 Tax=Laribacter hongkongensis TaxID=168471 RepID=A0A248LN92_9NEIS|nr:hypothetical protein LHGZ1_3138 [Laribacter hongkongensis]